MRVTQSRLSRERFRGTLLFVTHDINIITIDARENPVVKSLELRAARRLRWATAVAER